MTRTLLVLMSALIFCLPVFQIRGEGEQKTPAGTSTDEGSLKGEGESPGGVVDEKKQEERKDEKGPDAPEQKKTDPVATLKRILGGMKLSSERIRLDDASETTRTTQKQVVTDLDELIQLLEENSSGDQPPPDSSESPMPQDQQPDPKQGGQPQQQPQNSTGKSEGKPQAGKEKAGQDEGKSRESTQRREKTEPRPTDQSLSGQQLYEKEVWGHLPPSMRRELLNISSEKYIPQYEQMVRRYYEALARGNRRAGERP